MNKKHFNIILSYITCLFFNFFLPAQEKKNEYCKDSNSDEFIDYYHTFKKTNQTTSRILINSDICLPIVVQVMRDSDGTNFLRDRDIPFLISNINKHFATIGVRFYLAEIRYTDDDYWSNYNNVGDLNAYDIFNDPNATNIFIASGGGNSGGGVSSNSFHLSGPIFNNTDFFEIPTTILHEIGHYFGLKHTFSGTECGNSGPNSENVARTGVQANCDVAGDRICDTPADNRDRNLPSCSSDDFDIYGLAYEPDFTNFMSYYGDSRNNFTPQQYDVMQLALQTKLNSTDFDIDGYTPSVFPDLPQIISVESTSGYNKINWTNVSDNWGYLVERSSVSSTDGFVALALGGLVANTTIFKDVDIEANTEYWYRVIPINSCSTYSNTVNVTSAEFIYCFPREEVGCNNSNLFVPDNMTLLM